MNIEKALRNYIEGKGNKIKYEEFINLVKSNGNNAANVLFKLVNEQLDTMSDTKCLDRTIEVLKYLGVILANCQNVNRKLISRKLFKLEFKLETIESEGKNKFNLKHLQSEFEKLKNQIIELQDMTDNKDTKQYDFISYLINETKDMKYLEFTINKMPSLINIKDKNEISLFRNLVRKYLECVVEFNEEDLMYYNNLISYIMNQDNFYLSQQEKKACLQEINACFDKLTCIKKLAKKNKNKLVWIGRITEQIKGLDDEKKDITEIAGKYNIQVYFDEDVLNCANLVETPKEGEMLDREILDDYIITIDGPTAVEIDDALSCKKLENGNYLLGVHIASVLGYFQYDSNVIQEALDRNQSIYLPAKYQTKENDYQRTIPMFPYHFSADVASLIEGSPKLARTFYFEIDKNGEVVKERFIKSIIRNNKKMTYDEVNDILKNKTDDKELQETIDNLEEVTKLLDSKHHISELYKKIKENIKDPSELRVKKVGAENIVYQAMLLTGNRVAEFFAKKDFPCLYRVHETNKENVKKIQDMIDNLTSSYGGKEFKNLYKLIEGIYPRGWYDKEGSHDGLCLDHYCHCTSALRRAADIVVEHALEVCYDKEPTEEELQKLQEEIEKRAQQINSKQGPIEWFLKDYQRVYRRR